MKLSSETPRNPAEYRLGNARRNSRDTGPEKCHFIHTWKPTTCSPLSGIQSNHFLNKNRS